MNLLNIFLMVTYFSAYVLAAGKQPCENEADPDHGIGNFCACKDGCWTVGPGGHCNATGEHKYPSCPIGGKRT
ncbi:hypothetical protein Plec18167_002316 [Paecilomyces lecythidis]|uniref:Uncharacterized protein n=1 Tax=Paecilomyces lecythidis TaxID=3004212 RepID=A0ABR3Y8U2_9EURO